MVWRGRGKTSRSKSDNPEDGGEEEKKKAPANVARGAPSESDLIDRNF